MNWLDRTVQAIRSRWFGPFASNSAELAELFGRGVATATGIPVNEETALNYAAVFCAVALIADDISSLPLMLYKRLPNGGKERFVNHPLYRLLHDSPNEEMSTMTWRQTMQGHVLTWGNGYAEIERDGAGRPAALWPITPDRVTPFRDSDGVLRYRITNTNAPPTILDAFDMLHLHGLGFDGLMGYSPVAKARESIGLSVATERFGATFFGNGSTFGGVFEHPGRMSQPAQENFRKAIAERHQGVDRAHKFLIVEEGMKYQKLGIPPNDAQFLDTRVFQIREIARWYKIPPHKLADLADATFSNVEQMNIDYYTSCLRPWLTLWEEELSRKLIAPLEQQIQFVEHLTAGLLKADATARAALYTSQFHVGAIQPNEIRDLENLNPVKGGDRAFVPLNMIPIDRVDEYLDALIEAKKQMGPGAAKGPQLTLQEFQQEVKHLIDQFETRLRQDATVMVQLRETLALRDRDAADLTRQFRETEDARDALVKTGSTTAAALAAAEIGLKARAAELETLRITIAELEGVKVQTDGELTQARVQLAQAEAVAREIAVNRDTVVTGLQSKIAFAEGIAADLQAQLGLAEAAAQAAKALANRFEDLTTAREKDLDATTKDRDALRDECTTIAADRDAIRAELVAAGALRVHLKEQIERLTALAEEHARTLLATESARQHAESTAEDRARTIAKLDAALRTAESMCHVEQTERRALEGQFEHRRTALAAAHRALVIAAIERLVQREGDRARKAQITPEKFRAWVETFYPIHAEVVREWLRPALVAWAACVDRPADPLLDREVARHLDESTAALRVVGQHDDPDELASSLAHLLRRWETERPARIADALFREGTAA